MSPTGDLGTQLQRALTLIAGERTAPAVEQTAVREATRLLGAERSLLAFFDIAGHIQSVTRYRVGGMDETAATLLPEESFVQRAYEQGATVLHEPDAALPHAAVAAPCRLGERTLGALGAIYDTADARPSAAAVTTLTLLATYCASVIENARLNDYAQQELLRTQDLDEPWLSLVEAAPNDMVFIVAPDGRIIDANRTAYRMLGYTKYELLHRTIPDIVPSPSRREDQPVLRALIDDILAGRVKEFESAYITKSGRIFPAEVRVRPVEVAGQKVVVGLSRDISERKAAEAHMLQSDHLRTLGEMAAGVAHDMNNMLTAALGPIELVLATSQETPTRDMLQAARRALLDGAETVKRIQAFARQSDEAVTQAVNLLEVVRDVVEFTRPRWQTQAQQRNVCVDIVVEGADVPQIHGHAAELREALTNLVTNALDAMADGGRLTIAVERVGADVVVRLTDTGIGMPPEVMQRVFDPFFSTKRGRGSGLGLSVVYGIVKRHRGDIQLDSTPGQGTTFTLTFPVPSAEELAAAPAAAPPPERVERPAIAGPRARRALRVLVLDDQPPVAAVLQWILELDNQQHDVAVFTRASDALAALGDQRFDLICTDINMPDMSGWEFARLAKAHDPTVPIAIVTGWNEAYSAEELERRGADFLLRKPYQVSDVQRIIDQVQSQALQLSRRAPHDVC